MSTSIHHHTLRQIQKHLESAYPHEACGFLLGTQTIGHRHITSHYEVENRSTENLRRRFVIDPLDYMRAEKWVLQSDKQLLGIYHSHPDHPAIPSVHDLEYAQPFFSYFIHSIQGGHMTVTRSFRLLDGKLAEEIFTVTKDSRISN